MQSIDLKENISVALQKPQSDFIGSIGLGGIIGFVSIVLMLSFLLLSSAEHVFSLYALINWILLLTPREQLVAIILIPMYLAVLIFGGGILGIMIGDGFQKWFSARGFFKRNF